MKNLPKKYRKQVNFGLNMDLNFKNKKASFLAGFFVVDLQHKYGRNGGI